MAEDLKVQETQLSPAVEKNPVEKPAYKAYLTNDTIDILLKMEGDKAFVTTAQKFGQAIAESILLKATGQETSRFNFEEELPKRVEFKGNSFALIYKGNLPLRIAPHIWSLDQTTRRTWAVFTFNDFYGHKNSLKPWRRLMTPIVVTPFTTSGEMVDNFGKGYLSKYDEGTQFQMPLNLKDDATTEKIRVDNRNFISAALTLWQDLFAFTKAKMNMKLIYAIVAVAAIVVLAYFFWPTIAQIFGSILPH